MNLLVTGATGFIGAAVVRLARARGHRVAALTRQPRPDADDGLLRWLPGTLETPPWEQIERFAPDSCLHSAWIAEPGVYLDSPLNEDHLRWSVELFRRLAALGVPHALGLGTCIEYRITGEPLREDSTPLAPTFLYARCKDALRRTVETEIAGDAFRFAWGRVFYPYGPGEHPARLCTSLARKVLAGEPVLLKTPDSTKDYIFIDDLAAAILDVLERRLPGTINLGTGDGTPVRDIARTLGRLLGREELIGESATPSPDPLHHVVADARKLRTQTGWTPAHDLAAGLRTLVDTLAPGAAV